MATKAVGAGEFEPIHAYAHSLFLGTAEGTEEDEHLDVVAITGLLTNDPVPAIYTGVSSGTVGVLVIAWPDIPPSVPSADEWEDAAEMTVDYGDFPARPLGPATDGEAGGVLNAGGAGLYRVRVSGLGRDLAWDLTSETMDERYLIETWPVASHEAPTLLLSRSATSRQLQQQ